MAAAARPTLTLVLTPVDVEMEGCVATILEVSKLQVPWDQYMAVVQVRCELGKKEATSRVFTVLYKDAAELRARLATEVSKFRYMLFLYGVEELRRRGIAA